jgi:hypothetical protein
MCGVPLDKPVRVARIISTKHLGEMYVSEALLAEATQPLEQIGEAQPMRLDG